MFAVAALCILAGLNSTWRNPGVPLRDLPAMVEERYQSKLVVEAGVANQVVAFSVGDVRLGEFLAKVAEVSAAEVEERKDGSFRMFRSPKLAVQQQQAHLAATTRDFEDARAEVVREAKLSQPYDAEFVTRFRSDQESARQLDPDEGFFQNRKLRWRSSEARLGARLLSVVEPRDAGGIPFGEFRVFRAAPTAKQFRLRGNVRELADAFRAERRVWVQMLPPPASILATEVPTESSTPSGPSFLMPDADLEGPLADLVLVIGRPRRGSWSFQLYGVQPDGRLVEIWHQVRDNWERVVPPASVMGSGARAPTIAETEEFYRCVTTTQGGARVRPSEELRAKLLQPEVHEPWAFLGETMLSIGERFAHNLLFCPDDQSFRNLKFATEPGRSVDDFVTLAARDHELTLADGWLLMRPRDPHLARLQWLERDRLGRFVRLSSSEVLPSFREHCLVAPRAEIEPNLNPTGLYRAVLGNVRDYERSFLIWEDSRLWRAFVGSLDAPLWESLVTGRALPAAAVEGPARSALESVICGGTPLLFDSTLDAKMPDTSEDEPLPLRAHGRLDEMPTQALPNSLPAFATISLQTDSAPALLALMDQSFYRHARIRTTERLAWETAWADRRGEPLPLAEYTVGLQTWLRLRVNFDGRYAQHRVLDFKAQPGAKPVSLKDLPEGLRQEFAAHLEVWRAKVAESRIGGGKPPP